MPCDGRLLAGQSGGVQVTGQVFGRHLARLLEHDKRHGHLAEPCVGSGHYGGVAHRWVFDEQVFDVASGELLAATVDHVLDPPGDGDEAGAIDETDIPGGEPSCVVEGRPVGLRVEIAQHLLGSAHQQLACTARGQWLAIRPDDPDLHPRGDRAIGLRAQVERIGTVHHRHGRKLGHPVHPRGRNSLLFAAFHDHARHRRTTAGEHPQRQVHAGGAGGVGQFL